MGKTIAIANQKGGVGKTTTAINLGAALANENKTILLIDLDEQANATIGLGLSRELVEATSYELLASEVDIEDAIYETIDRNLHIIPASIHLSKMEANLANEKNKSLILAQKLAVVKDEYDYILLDCPPSLGVIVDNALFASDSVIIPVECDFLGYDALGQMIHKINQIQTEKKRTKGSLTVEGILLTKLDNRNVLGYKIVDKVHELFPEKTFKTIINRSSHLQEAPMYGKSVLKFAYNSRGSKEYRELAQEIIANQSPSK
ncbi:MAG: AAA family ATPase [Bacilli bacterium]